MINYSANQKLWSNSAEIFYEDYLEAFGHGDKARAKMLLEQYNSAANLANIYEQLCKLINSGYSEEDAKAEVNFYERLNNHFIVKQQNWLQQQTHFSPNSISVLTQPLKPSQL